jgi:drug/metabolite transporter (DMT)-like permease
VKWVLVIAGLAAMVAGLVVMPSLGDLDPDPSLLGCFLYAGGATALLGAWSWEDRASMPSDPLGIARWLFGKD